MLWATTLNEIRGRYMATSLGMLWVPLYPVLFLGIYATVYIYILQVRLQMFSSVEYVALIFCGLVPFLGFAEALGSGVGSVVANANLIRNTMVPIELIPVRAALVSQVTQVVGLLMLVAGVAYLGNLSAYVFLLPLVWLLQVIFMIGLLWVLSSINVFVRDLQSIIGIILLLLMLVSPIAYTIDMVPENLRVICWVNPLAHFIWAYQDVLVLHKSPDAGQWLVLATLSVGMFAFGFWVFTRLKTVFADNV